MNFPFIDTERRLFFFALNVLLSLLAFNFYIAGTTGIEAVIMALVFVAALYLQATEAVQEKAWKDIKIAALMLGVQMPVPLFATAYWGVFIGGELILLALLSIRMIRARARKSSEKAKREER